MLSDDDYDDDDDDDDDDDGFFELQKEGLKDFCNLIGGYKTNNK